MKSSRERYQSIVELVIAKGRVSISDLVSQLNVSEMTIRRDLARLDAEGAIRRIRGGALAFASGSYEPPFAARANVNLEAKTRIAQSVASLISDGDTVILDGGTTAFLVAEQLLDREITVCCLSLRVAEVFSNSTSVRLMVAGGIVRPNERTLIGPATLHIFENYRFDLYVMTVSAVDAEAGLTEWNLDDMAVKRGALGAASRCVLACDSSKFGKIAFGKICDIDRLDLVVTDSAVAPDQVSSLNAADVELRVS